MCIFATDSERKGNRLGVLQPIVAEIIPQDLIRIIPAEEMTMKQQNMTRGRYQFKATRPRARQLIACCALTATLFGGTIAAQNPPKTSAQTVGDSTRTLDEIIIRDVRV